MTARQWQMTTPLGEMFLVASATGLRSVCWHRSTVDMAESLEDPSPEVRILSQAVLQFNEYFSGRRRSFELPLDVKGTAFQKRVWHQLSKIPFGETCSYRDIAYRIEQKKAFRAVGTANGRNPLGVIVPCHRVIAADGTLGGYSGGLDKKIKLLELEKTFINSESWRDQSYGNFDPTYTENRGS